MKGRILTSEAIQNFKKYLREEEKSKNTIEKYMRDVWAFTTYMNGEEITKESVIAYKDKLISKNYAVRSINYAGFSQQSVLFSELDGLPSEVDQASTADLLSRRKRTNQSGIYAACKYRKTER